MPVEKSGQEEFDFQYGEDFGAHIETFDPELLKVLVRYNTEGDQESERAPGRAGSKRLGDWLHEHGRQFLLRAASSRRRPSRSRPPVATSSAGFAGAAPADAAWRSRSCRTAASSPTSGRSRASTGARIAGRSSSQHAAGRARRTWRASCSAAAPTTPRSITGCGSGSGVPGYVGFAIGRSIWWDPLKGFVDGNLGREDAASADRRQLPAVHRCLSGR